MPKYRTAIIACGTIGRVHARGWQDVPGEPVAIGAIADTHPDARREFGDFFGVPEEHRYADFREMLDRERPDFVDVCSWHRLHAEMVIAAAARQPKVILCQKPMAVDLAEADQMLTACERNGVRLFVAFQRPHHATWLKARELIRQGTIGVPIQVILDDGGNILNTNSHNIRLALFLMDEPRVEWVMGAVERSTEVMERGIPCEDRCLGLAGCENGATILIQGDLLSRRSSNGRSGEKRIRIGQGARIVGTDGIMELWTARPPDDQIRSDGNMAQPEGPSAKYNDERGVVRYLNGDSQGWVEVEAPWHDCWAHQCQEAIDLVDGTLVDGKPLDPISDARHGRAVQEVMMALFESARKRQRLHLPLKTMVNPLALMVERGDLPVEWPGAYERRARLVRGEAMSWHNA
ncbi:MAG: Gfo/Idh/MocA family oxidoreductase [Chloroflexota bacterium]|nr:Gfo/Idh/MocA family oxidoreductase [Chloroflexota bacterium]